MKVQDRYASAVNSSNLKSRVDTTMSDTDVLFAMGVADRKLSNGEDHYTKHPLAVPLERLFAGDNTAASTIINILTGIIRSKAQGLRIKLPEHQARDMARAILGWFQKPACPVCKGHGFGIIPGSTTLGGSRCNPCNGTGKVQIELLFRAEHRQLVRWAVVRVELESNMAGPEAMKLLANSLDL
jgi:hypothetical protein